MHNVRASFRIQSSMHDSFKIVNIFSQIMGGQKMPKDQETSSIGLKTKLLALSGIFQHIINWIMCVFQTLWCFGILIILNMEHAFSLYEAARCIIEENSSDFSVISSSWLMAAAIWGIGTKLLIRDSCKISSVRMSSSLNEPKNSFAIKGVSFS